ncbi:MAG: folate-binding protein [Salinarimonadaceae bacterium]|nr:MAG: folate-binding protein [Salinarimonadaceae bacterium]
MPAAHLEDRGVIKVSGEAAKGFLDGLVTCDLDRVAPDAARHGALLSPQGKILFDFIVFAAPDDIGGGYFLDCPAAFRADLAKRLGFYRLRAKVAIEDRTEELAVLAGWDAPAPPAEVGLASADPRLPALGWRALVARVDVAGLVDADEGAYHARRIALGVPEGGKDYVYGSAFPHEALMDKLGGVDFDKGCYVGQEVVSRMQHRGTARTRILPVTYGEGPLPETGADVTAGERVIGAAGSAANGRGLVMVRIDRAQDALDEGVNLRAGGRDFAFVSAEWLGVAAPSVQNPVDKDADGR